MIEQSRTFLNKGIHMQINEELQDRIRHIANLPTLPQVASRLMKIINDPMTSSSDVAFVVGQDLSLSAKILRLANSAFYGIPRSITNINNAVVILGLKVINTMVLSLTVFDMFPENKRSKLLFDRKAFWIHSLACGTIAKKLATKVKKFVMFDPEEAFCAGLLHDIGKVVMEQYLHEDFHLALKTSKTDNIPMYEAEEEVLGFDHTDVAEWLTSGWGLPMEIQLPLINHHDPAISVQCQDIVALCHYADWLCYETGTALDKSYPRPELDTHSIEHLRIEDSDIEFIKEKLPEELEKTTIFYDVAAGK